MSEPTMTSRARVLAALRGDPVDRVPLAFWLRALMTRDECRRFQRPFDLPVLDAVAGASFNLLHVCGDDVHFDAFADYPVHASAGRSGPATRR